MKVYPSWKSFQLGKNWSHVRNSAKHRFVTTKSLCLIACLNVPLVQKIKGVKRCLGTKSAVSLECAWSQLVHTYYFLSVNMTSTCSPLAVILQDKVLWLISTAQRTASSSTLFQILRGFWTRIWPSSVGIEGVDLSASTTQLSFRVAAICPCSEKLCGLVWISRSLTITGRNRNQVSLK